MLNLDAQRKEFDIVISDITRCYYDTTDFFDYLNKCGCTWYLILHDKDYNDLGEHKREHYHLVLLFEKRYRCKQILNQLCDVLYTNVENIQIAECYSVVGSIQYLIHKNQKEKYQYDISEIKTNDDRDNLSAIMSESIKPYHLTTNQLKNLILVDKLNKMQLIDEIGIGSYQHYRPTINDLYEIAFLEKRKQ